jgi:hypothetical protein
MVLAGVPLVVVAQCAAGGLLGHIAARAIEGRSPLAWLLGWREPLHPTKQAEAIAASAAAAIGAPMVRGCRPPRAWGRGNFSQRAGAAASGCAAAATPRQVSAAPTHLHAPLHHRPPQAGPALTPRNHGIPAGLPLLVTLACAFHNCLSLPMLYLSSMLPTAEVSRAAATASVYCAAWAVLLYAVGLPALRRQQRSEELGAAAAAWSWQRRGRGTPGMTDTAGRRRCGRRGHGMAGQRAAGRQPAPAAFPPPPRSLVAVCAVAPAACGGRPWPAGGAGDRERRHVPAERPRAPHQAAATWRRRQRQRAGRHGPSGRGAAGVCGGRGGRA